jgi:group I intron endonuclease
MRKLENIIEDLKNMNLKNSCLLEKENYLNRDELYKTYLHYNIKNGKIYVGQTKQILERRFRSKGSGYRGSSRFSKAVKYYGWDSFKTIIIQDKLTNEEANLFEEKLINRLDSMGKNTGYNDHLGGLNKKPSEETRKKLSESHKGNKSRIGTKHSEESKKIMSEKKKKIFEDITKHPNFGKYGSNSNYHVSVVCLNIDTKELIRSDSTIEMSKIIGSKNPSAITSVCKGKELTIKRHICVYEKEFDGNKELLLKQYIINRKQNRK